MLHEGERATDASEMGPYGARSSRSRARPEIGNIANLIAHVCWRDGRGGISDAIISVMGAGYAAFKAVRILLGNSLVRFYHKRVA